MSYIQCSNEAKPQSIVHHIGRLSSKITKPISNRRKRMRMQRKLRGEGSMVSSQQSVTISSSSDNSSILAPESYRSSMEDCSLAPSAAVSDDNSSQGDYHTVDSDDFSFFSDIDEDDVGEEEDDCLFETLDQNSFLTECFLTNGQSDVVFLVHFFNQETSISNSIEDVLSLRVLESKSKCECRRINSKSAPLFTAKLQIDPEQPTIVAIKNGKVLSKVSDISSSQCTEVDQWLARTRILQSNVASDDTFSGL
ncbi:unnamed protein product [Cylindrotheca closterium]|uniref:Uncharacterized protein n=1 Tax=Cylindrotheca closterium TaxID=2856 RepID=A0AAD2G1U7_9STRA|nr:unnamed protein product [Cylindrotheca closterium]